MFGTAISIPFISRYVIELTCPGVGLEYIGSCVINRKSVISLPSGSYRCAAPLS